MTAPYALSEETTPEGHAVAWLHDEEWSVCRTVAPPYDCRNPAAARQALAESIARNMARDRMTQIVLDPARIPQPFADLLRVQLEIEIKRAAASAIVWRAALDVLPPKATP